MFPPFSATQSFDKYRVCTTLPSGEKATDGTESEWPSSVCSAALIIASQSRTVLSPDSDTTSLPFSEKTTNATQSE
jgi:hypothetical protein